MITTIAVRVRVRTKAGAVRVTRTGACTPTCWNATDRRCTCVCNGRNHGEGWIGAKIHNPLTLHVVRSRIARSVANEFQVELELVDVELTLQSELVELMEAAARRS